MTAFQAIARHYGRPSSETVLFSGYPIDVDDPTFEQIDRASARCGLEVSRFTRKIRKLSASDLPALVFSQDGSVTAILEETKRGVFTTHSGSGSEHQTVSRRDLKRMKPKMLLSFSALYLNNGERANIGVAEMAEKRHWLSEALSPLWGAYINVAIAAMFINLIGLAIPIFIMNVYDRILPNQALYSLWVLAAGVCIALVFDYLLKLARSAIIDHTGREADQKLAYSLFEKVLHTRLSSRPDSTGEFSSRLGQYEFVREFFTSNTISVLIDAAFVFIFVLVIYYLAGWLAIIPAVAFFASLFIGLIAQYRIGKRVARAANEAAQRNAVLVESVATIETVKALRAEAHLLRKWTELTKNASKTAQDIKQISAGATSATQFIQYLVSVAIVIAGAYAYAGGMITTGGIIATVMLASRTVAPLAQISMTLARLKQAMLSLKILNLIMQQPEDRPSSTGFVNRDILTGSVDLHSVEFAYPETDNSVLSNISFSVRSGERVGIIGKIGSGKTTLGKLLGGLFEPKSGRLLIDGIDIRQFHPHEVRKAVAFVSQSSDLFTGTLKENLLIARPDASDQDLIEAGKKAGVDEFASRHPRGYDMPVGERGEKLSGGQKQAVTIARLLMNEPKIVFLDEPSGAMDMASERNLVANLKQSFNDDTTLFVSTHRYSLLGLVDRLIVLDNGKLVADGPKDQVMSELNARAKAAVAKSQ
ncbi:MAG: type I secretion system permease/ATPase [Rhizobiaceae bacterium]